MPGYGLGRRSSAYGCEAGASCVASRQRGQCAGWIMVRELRSILAKKHI